MWECEDFLWYQVTHVVLDKGLNSCVYVCCGSWILPVITASAACLLDNQRALYNVVLCGVFAVGGIYTVIRTKAAVTVEELGDRYFLIGPYNESCVRTELDIMEPPNEAVAHAFHQMREHGLKVCLCMALHYLL